MMWECHRLQSTHFVRVYFFVFIVWQILVSLNHIHAFILKKCMFMVNDPIQRCENVIVYDPHILLESIFSSLLPGNYLYLFTNFHTCILKTQVCGKWLHFTMWECHPLLSTHIVRVYFFIVIAWQQLVSVYQFSCLYLRNASLW